LAEDPDQRFDLQEVWGVTAKAKTASTNTRRLATAPASSGAVAICLFFSFRLVAFMAANN
jgi:hypothetical protein